jgi:hypothetical protein
MLSCVGLLVQSCLILYLHKDGQVDSSVDDELEIANKDYLYQNEKFIGKVGRRPSMPMQMMESISNIKTLTRNAIKQNAITRVYPLISRLSGSRVSRSNSEEIPPSTPDIRDSKDESANNGGAASRESDDSILKKLTHLTDEVETELLASSIETAEEGRSAECSNHDVTANAVTKEGWTATL